MTAEEIMERLRNTPGIEFDYTPLDIGHLRKEGYGDTRKTWETIKDWVDFSDRSCIDIGACCGFVTDKLIKAGAAEVIAVEVNKAKCEAMDMMLDFNSKLGVEICAYIQCVDWLDYDPPRRDWTILALNVLHKFRLPDRYRAVYKMLALPWSHIILESDDCDCDLVKSVAPPFAKVREERSPGRPSRRLLMLTNEDKVAV